MMIQSQYTGPPLVKSAETEAMQSITDFVTYSSSWMNWGLTIT
jgi:hypothetical protein